MNGARSMLRYRPESPIHGYGIFTGDVAEQHRLSSARCPLRPCVRSYDFQRLLKHSFVPALSVSRVCSAAMSLQGGAEAFDQGGCGEWLGQEANCSGLQRSGANVLIGKGRNENESRTVTLGAHMDEQIQTAHRRHLHIRNYARRALQLRRP